MRKDLTEIVFILDRSGSMSTVTDDTIGGFNSFVDNQKKESGEAVLTTVLFDNEYIVLHDGINIQNVKKLTNEEYYARGSTALLDAIGKTINTVGNRIDQIKKKEQPKVIFVITTDGFENSSKEYSQSNIKNLIENRTKKNKWEFLFLGANIDSFSVASGLGISFNNTSNYTANSVGTQSLYATLSRTVADYAEKGTITTDWAKDIQ